MKAQNQTPQNQRPVWGRSQKVAVAGLLLVQFTAAYFIGAGHWLTNDGHYLVAPIAVTAAFPVVLFLAAYALSMRFRGFVLSQDIRTLTMMQHWRVVGFAFLPLYAFGVLPGLFAWPLCDFDGCCKCAQQSRPSLASEPHDELRLDLLPQWDGLVQDLLARFGD